MTVGQEQTACHHDGLCFLCVPPAQTGSDPGVPEEADVDQSWLGMALGMIVLVIAAFGVVAHYRRERRRADLLRNLDHHEWCRWTRSRH